MISEADKLLRIVKKEIGYKITEKNNKYAYDLKYVYNVIDKNTDIDDYSQLFIIWCFIKAFGKVRAFQLLGIPADNTEMLTLERIQKLADNNHLLFSPEGVSGYAFFKTGLGDQILYSRDSKISTGLVIDKSNTAIKIIELKNSTMVVETLLDESILENNVIGIIKYLDDGIFIDNLQNEAVSRNLFKIEAD